MRIASFLLAVYLLSGTVLPAVSYDEIAEEQKRYFDYHIYEESIPEIAEENSDIFDVDLNIESVADFFKPTVLLKALGGIFLSGLKNCFPGIGIILAISALSFFLKSFTAHTSVGSASTVLDTLITFSVSAVLYSGIYDSLEAVKVSSDGLNAFLTGILPVSGVLLTASGSPGLASASVTLIYGAVSFFSFVLSEIVPFFINLYFCLCIASALYKNDTISVLSGKIRNFSTGIMLLIYSLFSGVGALQKILTSAGDSLAKRGIKFAAGSYIPIAGSYISEGLETVLACINTLKNSGGIFSVAVILVIVIVPAVRLLASCIFLALSALCCRLFDNSITENFLNVMKDTYFILFSFILGYGGMLCFLVTVMLTSGGT